MGMATVQLVGNVGTDLQRSLGNGTKDRVSFRLIANERYRDTAGNWVDGDECAVNVTCWGALARGVAQSVRLGDPLVVAGRLSTRRYEVDGVTRYSTDVKASYVGHDLSRGTSNFQRQRAATDGTENADRAENHDPAESVGSDAVEEILAAAF
jgi:single-strand DNA-binding protein